MPRRKKTVWCQRWPERVAAGDIVGRMRPVGRDEWATPTTRYKVLSVLNVGATYYALRVQSRRARAPRVLYVYRRMLDDGSGWSGKCSSIAFLRCL